MTGEQLLHRSERPHFCEHFITHEELGSTDPWAGTYCKLWAGHSGPHSALYADERRPTKEDRDADV